MNKSSTYFALVSIALALILTATSPLVPAQEAPQISSSLAKNLWRQAHFFFDEGMDDRAIRACEELLAWARENNEPAIEKKMSEMLAALQARQQAPAVTKPATAAPAPAMQTNHPDCGFASVKDIPATEVYRIITTTPQEFLVCQQDRDCTVAYNFCGTNRAVNKSSQTCYEAVARQFDISAGCSPADPVPASAVCRNQSCLLQYQ